MSKVKLIYIAVPISIVTALICILYIEAPPPKITYPSLHQPYSVFVDRYRRAEDAERAAERLRRDLNSPSFVLKIDQTKRGTWFEAHLGPWATTESAHAAQSNAKSRGLSYVKVKHLSDYEKNWDYASSSTSISLKAPLDFKKMDPEVGPDLQTPGSIPITLASLLNVIPINQDMTVVDMSVYNPLGSTKGIQTIIGSQIVDGFYFPSFIDQKFLFHKTDASVAVKLEDKLYHRRMSVLILSPKGQSAAQLAAIIRENSKAGYEKANYAVVAKKKLFFIGDIELNGDILTASKDGKTTITLAVSVDHHSDTVYIVRSLNESEEHIDEALKNSKTNQSVSQYGEVTRTLYTLPSSSRFELLSYRLDQVDDEYVQEKSFADWAEAMRGHWSATAIFLDNQDDNIYLMQVFDLRTLKNSNWIYEELYGKEKRDLQRQVRANEYLRYLFEDIMPEPVKVRDAKGWYVRSLYGGAGEINFSHSRWIFAVSGIQTSKSETLAVAEDLQAFAMGIK